MWGDTGVCGAGVKCNGLIGKAAVLLAADGMIRTAKQLPEVSRTAVWGRAALCLAGFPAIGGVAISKNYEDKSHFVKYD
jgi:hypothetical protein